MEDDDIRKKVSENYGSIARGEKTHYNKGESSEDTSGCSCGCSDPGILSGKIGYSENEMGDVPDGANLGLGCGNPTAHASLSLGNVVLDLGSGAGFDCFLAAKKVGPTGRVIGVDMTEDMLERARENALKGDFTNVDFRKGLIEDLPIDDSEVDVVISNCVINLSPDKDAVFKEAFRVLKPGGRLMISDIVLEREIPSRIRDSVTAYVGCVSGADMKEDYLQRILKVGFEEVKVIEEIPFPIDCLTDESTLESLRREAGVGLKELEGDLEGVKSIKVSALKPER